MTYEPKWQRYGLLVCNEALMTQFIGFTFLLPKTIYLKIVEVPKLLLFQAIIIGKAGIHVTRLLSMFFYLQCIYFLGMLSEYCLYRWYRGKHVLHGISQNGTCLHVKEDKMNVRAHTRHCLTKMRHKNTYLLCRSQLEMSKSQIRHM